MLQKLRDEDWWQATLGPLRPRPGRTGSALGHAGPATPAQATQQVVHAAMYLPRH